jgi:hypothetical protein
MSTVAGSIPAAWRLAMRRPVVGCREPPSPASISTFLPGVHQNDIDLGTEGVGTYMVRLHELFQLGLARFVASNGLDNVNEPSLSTVISKAPSLKR